MGFLSDRRFLAISLGHFTVDVFNSLVPVLLTALSAPLLLSNANIGLIVTAYSFGGSLSQPLFGYLADRFGGRRLAIGGVAWLLLFFGLAPLAPGKWALLCIVLAALGSGAYHPQGASNAAKASLTHAATATAFFFLFGQVGLALGPAMSGALLDMAGLRGLWLPVLAGLAFVVFLSRTYGGETAGLTQAVHREAPVQSPGLRVATPLLIVFALMIFLRSSVQSGTTTFIPKLFAERGMSATSYGLMLSAFMLGSSAGGVVGGNLADRFGRRLIVAITLMLMAGPLVLYLRVNGFVVIWLLVALAGALHGASHSIIVVIAQAMLPGRQALASGLILGFMFTSGAIGAYLVGVAADHIGLQTALTSLAGVCLIAALLALALPATATASSEVAVEVRGEGHPAT